VAFKQQLLHVVGAWDRVDGMVVVVGCWVGVFSCCCPVVVHIVRRLVSDCGGCEEDVGCRNIQNQP